MPRPPHRRRRLTARAEVLLRVAIAAFAFLVSLGPAARFYMSLSAGTPAHVCHCEERGGHASCACPICFPELRSDDDHDAPRVRGVCGDENPVVHSAAQPAVTATAFALVPRVWRERASAPPLRDLRSRSSDPPDHRPPRVVG